MKLAVCGCSWSSECEKNPNTGFGTHLSNLLVAKYKKFARPSASNFIIRLQVEQAIKEKFDLVVVVWTNVERVEWHMVNSRKYYPHKGLQDVSYRDYKDSNNNPAKDSSGAEIITAESLNSMGLDKSFDHLKQSWGPDTVKKKITEQQWTTWKQFYTHNYDYEIEAHKQYFYVESAVHSLQQNNIQFVMAPGYPDIIDHTPVQPTDEYEDNWSIIPEQNLVREKPVDIYSKRMIENPYYQSQYVYHIEPSDQIDYASILYTKIKQIL